MKAKKHLSVLLSILMVLSVFFGLSIMTSAANWEDVLTYDKINGNTEIIITKCVTSASGSLTIPSEIEGLPVTGIGNSAFSGCSSLTSVTIPDGVTSIGSSAFRDCSSLTSINIPDSVTSIQYSAFSNCTSLTSVNIPDSVTSIGSSAFSSCSSLTSINVNAGNQNYSSADGVLFNKEKTTLICCPEGKSGIYVIPNSVTSIENYAFSGCSSLSSVNIPDSIISIGISAFSGCSSLTSINIPDSVTSIQYSAFSNCTSLTSVNIPDSVTSIGSSAFSSCSSLTSINVNAGNQNYSSADGVLFNKEKTTLICCPEGKSGIYVIPNSVTSIENYAFSGCSSLSSVNIPDSIISIGISAFSGCSSLTSITIPDSVTSIGEGAFFYTAYYNNSANWQNGVLYIGKHLIKAKADISGDCTIKMGTLCIADDAFSYCSLLTSVMIPDSVTSIGDRAFYGCSSLSSVNIPDSVTSIGWGAFYGCSSLSSVTIGNGVTSIGDRAFYGCSSLSSVNIPDSVTSIGWGAFYGCLLLTAINVSAGNKDYSSINGVLFNKDATELIKCPEGKTGSYTIPNSVTSIGNSAFSGCSSLTSINIPDSVTSIGYSAFYGCSSLTAINVSAGNENYSSIDGVLFDKDVTWLIQCPGGKTGSHTIPNSVTSIGDYAFKDSSSLTGVTIPDSVTNIGSSVFSGCTSLTAINVSAGNKNYSSIDGVLFDKDATELKLCPQGKSGVYIIPNSITSIGGSAFSYCTSLTSVTIGNSVTSIGDYAFSGCSSLTAINVSAGNKNYSSIDGVLFDKDATELKLCPQGKPGVYIIPNSITSIGGSAFSGCSSLTSVTIGNSVTSIGDYAFSGCSSLTSINIPDGVISIGDRAFFYCTSLAGVIIPDSVKSIGGGAFYGCRSIMDVTIGNSVKSIGSDAFRDCFSLANIKIPNSVKSIGGGVFNGCSSLTGIELPYNLSSIGREAFLGCSSLQNLVMPSGVTNVGFDIFSRCTSLTELTTPSDTKRYNADSFYNAVNVTTLKFGNFAWNDDGALKENTADYSNSDKVELNKFPTANTDDIYFYNPEVQIIGKVSGSTVNVHGYKNSTAERFAADNGYPFFSFSRFSLTDGSVLSIDHVLDMLTGVNEETTAAGLLSQFCGGNIGIYKNGVPLEDNDFVGTGCIIRLMDGEEILDSLTVIIKGDVDGDGKVNISDARKVLRVAVNLENFDGNPAAAYAADIDGSGKSEISDARKILRVAVGLQSF